jgi:hypothetical protein
MHVQAANIRGTIEFDTPAGATIGALGIRIPRGAPSMLHPREYDHMLAWTGGSVLIDRKRPTRGISQTC